MILSRNKWWKILKICYWYSLRKLLVMFFFQAHQSASQLRIWSHERGDLILSPKASKLILQIFWSYFNLNLGNGYSCSKVLQFWSLTLQFLYLGLSWSQDLQQDIAFWRLLHVSSTLINWKYLKGEMIWSCTALFIKTVNVWLKNGPYPCHRMNHIKSLQLNEFLFLPNFHQVSTVPIHFLSFENL